MGLIVFFSGGQLIEYGSKLRPASMFATVPVVTWLMRWLMRNGKPAVRTARLPDADTDMNMDAFYRECLRAGLTDLEVVSRIRLYGVSSMTTAATGVDVLQNYKLDADGLNHILKDRLAKLSKRWLGETLWRPNGIPYRNHLRTEPKFVGSSVEGEGEVRRQEGVQDTSPPRTSAGGLCRTDTCTAGCSS
jgi:hypothetical protein